MPIPELANEHTRKWNQIMNIFSSGPLHMLFFSAWNSFSHYFPGSLPHLPRGVLKERSTASSHCRPSAKTFGLLNHSDVTCKRRTPRLAYSRCAPPVPCTPQLWDLLPFIALNDGLSAPSPSCPSPHCLHCPGAGSPAQGWHIDVQ